MVICGSTECSEPREYIVLDVHPRLRELRASSISGRLQLAALYAASVSSTVPDPRAGMSGKELAIQLVRQCFVNTPLSEYDVNLCCNVANLCGDVPALFLVCELLLASSQQLSFLHVNSKADGSTSSAAPAAKQLNERQSNDNRTTYLL